MAGGLRIRLWRRSRHVKNARQLAFAGFCGLRSEWRQNSGSERARDQILLPPEAVIQDGAQSPTLHILSATFSSCPGQRLALAPLPWAGPGAQGPGPDEISHQEKTKANQKTYMGGERSQENKLRKNKRTNTN